MRSLPPLPVHWNQHQGETRFQNGSPSSRTRMQLLGGWHQTNLAPGSSTLSRRGTISARYAGQTRHYHRDLAVPRAQGNRHQREGR